MSNYKIAFNSLTDPGVLFGAGNALINYNSSALATSLNLGMTGICLVIRAASEMRKDGREVSLPKPLQTLADNPGAALATSGVFNLLAAASTAYKGEWINTAINGAFGLGNLLRGTASGLKQGTLKQRFMDAVGICSANTGLYIASPDAPLPVKLAYVGTAAIALYLSATNQKPQSWKQPDLTNAAMIAVNASNNTNPVFITANAIWAVAYASLDALKKHGGVAEWFQNWKKPRDPAANVADLQLLP